MFLIDAHALCYRAYYAIKGLTNSRGQETNAVYGFINILKKILREYDPKYIAICFDTPAKTHREEKYEQYKIQRPHMPDGLIAQIPLIKKVVRAYGLTILECDGYEADDVIATIVGKIKAPDLDIVIASDDKDVYQLVDKRVKVFNSKQNRILEKYDVIKILGFDPQYMTDYIALAGDATDNIPGIKGIGQVSARKLIDQFGDLSSVLKNIDNIKPERLKNLIQQQKQDAALSKELAILDQKVPLQITLKGLSMGEPNNKELFALFSELELRKFAQEIAENMPQDAQVEAQDLKDKKDLEKLIRLIKKEKTFSFVCLGDPDPYQSLNGCTISIFCKKDCVYTLGQDLIKELNDVFSDTTITKITCDIKSDLKKLKNLGIDDANNIFDVTLAGHLLQPERNLLEINDLCWKYLKRSSLNQKNDPINTKNIFDLYQPLHKELKKNDLLKLLLDIEIPLAFILVVMEERGVALDTKFLKNLSKECHNHMEDMAKHLYEIAGQEFNLNSPKQLSEILFVKLGLPVIKKTKTGFSTNEAVLKQLSSQHELPALILEYRQMAKLLSTYIDALPLLVDAADGKIHATFDQSGTETGRLSSRDPNLQNIPIRTDLGRRIRRAFIAENKENFILSADYSQIELRILAHLSKDETLHNAFEKDQDIHQYTAALIFDVNQKNVTKDMRNVAKRVNFGIIYGMSPFGLAKDLEITYEQADEFITRYFRRYNKVKDFMDQQIALCEKNGYVTTLLNRRRYIPDIKSPNVGIRQFAQRQAINTPVQGTAADLIKLAMIDIHRAMAIKNMKSGMIITVHDELVFDVRPGELDDLCRLVKEKMEKALTLSVPVKVALKRGKNWLDMEKIV